MLAFLLRVYVAQILHFKDTEWSSVGVAEEAMVPGAYQKGRRPAPRCLNSKNISNAKSHCATKLTEPSGSFNTRSDAGSLLVAMQSHPFLCYLDFWQPVLCEVNDAQNYLETEGLNIHQCAKKRVLQTVLEGKREEFVDDALLYTKSLCEELEISFEPPRRIRRKHTFGDGSKNVQLSYGDDLRRTMFSF
ncbi:uncharacterized protein TNCV_477211 [Trichonephila clavipes]|nr:uncharacterized protein TNCV_477211 [Trichonephila clavipes]